jgi:hypothetical protein
MHEIAADPDTLHKIAPRLGPGDVVTLRAGTYTQPVALADVQGTASRPLVIRGGPGVVFDGGRSADDYRGEGNIRSIEGEKQGYPGLWPFIHQGMITLERCRHVTLEGFTIRRCWPTGIFIRDSQQTTIFRLHMEDATFAIGALGSSTYGITIDEVTWCQDVTRDRLWRRIPWIAVHGAQPVDIGKDWRLFDGDFFRSSGIRGGVTVRNCVVEHAFNAVHGFNPSRDPGLSVDFAVHDCRFSYVRDNVFEPEDHALNWWFYRNRIANCHKWFSIESSASGFAYIFSNLGWFDEIPGQPGQDNRAGGVFKLAKTQKPAWGLHYVFNNSFAVRSDYIRKGALRGFRHWGNAVRYCQAGEGVCDARSRFFGDLSEPAGSTDERFSTDWRHWDIEFAEDVILHPEFTATLQAAGYGPFTGSVPDDPGFEDPVSPGPDGAGLRLKADSACRGRGLRRDVELPDGSIEPLPKGRDLGALEGADFFRWREFQTLPANVA